MRLLYITERPRILPYMGSDLRIESQIAALRSIAEVETFELQKGGLERPSAEAWAKILKGEVPPFSFQRTPQVIARFEVENQEREFDYIVLGRLEATSILEIVRSKFPETPVILDLDELIIRRNESLMKLPFDRARKVAWARYFPLLQKYELEILQSVDQIWVSSEIEQERLAQMYQSLPDVFTIPNTIPMQEISHTKEFTKKKILLFVGSFQHPPNKFAAEELMDAIMPKLQDFTLHIVGRDMPSEWSDLNFANIRFFPNAADLTVHYQDAMAAIIPLRAGAGTRLKAIEAMAHGLPIISTELGVEGLGMNPGQHYCRAESSEEFVSSVRALFENISLQVHLRKEGFQLYEDQFRLTKLTERISAALAVLAN